MPSGSHSVGIVVADSALRSLFRYIGETHGLPSEEWLRTRLNDPAKLRRSAIPTSGPVDLAMSQAQLATMMGVSRQTLSALLVKLEARGLIKIGFRSIRMLP